jgi:hypothetical protein
VFVQLKGRGAVDPGVTPVGRGASSHCAVVAVASAVWFQAWCRFTLAVAVAGVVKWSHQISYTYIYMMQYKSFSLHGRYTHHQLSYHSSIVKSTLHHLSDNLTCYKILK